MPVHNADVAALFDESADLREREEANPFRVRADRNAARVVRDLSQDVTGMVAAGEDHTELPGVGEHPAGKIREIVTTGRCALLSELHKHAPPRLERRAARGIDTGKSTEAALSRALDTLRESGLTNSVAAGEKAARE
jgi:DNA polymerase/3'-5' exonuclease PolX